MFLVPQNVSSDFCLTCASIVESHKQVVQTLIALVLISLVSTSAKHYNSTTTSTSFNANHQSPPAIYSHVVPWADSWKLRALAWPFIIMTDIRQWAMRFVTVIADDHLYPWTLRVWLDPAIERTQSYFNSL